METTKIQTEYTTDYAQFKLIEGNRKIYPDHVHVLAESYKAHPELIELRPVLVNEHFEIVDGQHRMMACKAAERPVPYILVPGLTIQTAQLLNATQKAWNMIDYLHSYAIVGNRDYQIMENLLTEYKIPMSSLLMYTGLEASDHQRKVKFRRGQATIVDEARTRELLDHLEDFADFPWYASYNFAVALLKTQLREGYSVERMREKKRYAPPMTQQPSIVDYLKALENIYNWKTGETNYVRFI